MKHIYVLLPDAILTKRVVDNLLLAHINWQNIHVIANRDVSLENLPQAEITQKSDLMAALTRGTAVGGLSGMLAGLVAVALPPLGLTLAGGAILATTITGAGIGAWAGGLIGVSVPNSQLEQFDDAIKRGELLLIVDVSHEQEEEIKSIIVSQYPSADFHSAHRNQPELVT